MVFFDAAALVSAAGSPHGGAAATLELCREHRIHGVISTTIEDEASRNADQKLSEAAQDRLAAFAERLDLEVVETPPISAADFPRINAKDRHVYAAALLVGADYVITHDRALIAEINAQGGVRALTPGDFLQQIAPTLIQVDD